MKIIGTIDPAIYSCITERIVTREVVLTQERIAHIEERHPDVWRKIEPFLQLALEAPDYILQDKSPNTGLILKFIEEKDLRFQIVLRIYTPADPTGWKNSILSGWEINESRWKNYIRNKKILYKREYF